MPGAQSREITFLMLRIDGRDFFQRSLFINFAASDLQKFGKYDI